MPNQLQRKLLQPLLVLATGFVTACAVPTALRAQSQDPSSQSESVADAARKAREKQRTTPKAKKVYTDDDIKPAQQPPSAQPGQGAVPAPAAAQPAQGDQAAATSDAPQKNDEASWRKRFAAQREKIARAEKELDLLQREQNKAQLQYYSDPQKALTEQYTRQDINEKDAKIAAKRKEIDDLKQQLSDMEEQLRKSGGDPGWARQ